MKKFLEWAKDLKNRKCANCWHGLPLIETGVSTCCIHGVNFTNESSCELWTKKKPTTG